MSYKYEDKLIEAVKSAYDNYDPILLNYIWLSLQNCMIEILDCKGNNNYVQPHMKKAALDRQGKLPVTLGIKQHVIDEANYWVEHGTMEDYPVEEYESDSEAEMVDSEGEESDSEADQN